MKPRDGWKKLMTWSARVGALAVIVGALVAVIGWVNSRAESRVCQRQTLAEIPRLVAHDSTQDCAIQAAKQDVCSLRIEQGHISDDVRWLVRHAGGQPSIERSDPLDKRR